MTDDQHLLQDAVDDEPSEDDDMVAMGNRTLSSSAAPSVQGEQSVSGDMPDPSSADDTLENEHDVGLQLDSDEENPQELNIAADVAAAERHRDED